MTASSTESDFKYCDSVTPLSALRQIELVILSPKSMRGQDTLPFFHHCQSWEFDMSKIVSKLDGKVNVDGTMKDRLKILTMGIFSIRWVLRVCFKCLLTSGCFNKPCQSDISRITYSKSICLTWHVSMQPCAKSCVLHNQMVWKSESQV